jgi:hypothetical protein
MSNDGGGATTTGWMSHDEKGARKRNSGGRPAPLVICQLSLHLTPPEDPWGGGLGGPRRRLFNREKSSSSSISSSM